MNLRQVVTILIIVFILGASNANAAGVADASYLSLRDYTYGLLNEQVLDTEEFTKLVVDQGYKYRFVDWIGDAYHSIFFNNPKGSEVLYNDFIMALAIGYKRMNKPEELKKPLTRVIDRRLRMWHGTKNSNYYAREYSSLASLAYLLDDERFGLLQEKVRKSVDKLYLEDGYAYEGPDYGLYSMSILSGYVYFTEDDKVKQKLISNINWLASISSEDGYKPPFDDSLADRLPKRISAFKEVNEYWAANFTFNNIPLGSTFNKQETVWRYDDTTIWSRYRKKNKEWLGMHRNYSNGDVLLKVDNIWWITSPGYMGRENKKVFPEQHNIAMSKWSYTWRFFWRLFGGEAKLVKHEEGDSNKEVISLDGSILRTIESDSTSLVVNDEAKKNFIEFWQINGKLIKSQQNGNIVSLKWQQGDSVLTQVISGVYKISIEPGFHTEDSIDNIIQHSRLIIEGKNINNRFVW